jgi:hypothetical protein
MLAIMKFPPSFTAFACHGSDPTDERVASNSIEHWTATLDGLAVASCDDDQLLAFGCFGTPEDRTAQKLLSFAAVLGGKPPGKCRADRATRDVNATILHRGSDAIPAEHKLCDGMVV